MITKVKRQRKPKSLCGIKGEREEGDKASVKNLSSAGADEGKGERNEEREREGRRRKDEEVTGREGKKEREKGNLDFESCRGNWARR